MIDQSQLLRLLGLTEIAIDRVDITGITVRNYGDTLPITLI